MVEQAVGTCGGSTVRTDRFRMSKERAPAKTEDGETDWDWIFMGRKEVKIYHRLTDF